MLRKRKKELDYDYEENYEEDEDEIDLLEIVMIVRRHIKVIIAIAAIFLCLGVGFAMSRVATYKSTTTLIVSSGNYYNAKNLDSGELSLNQKLATTYTEVAKSPSVLNSVIKRLDLDMKTNQLSKLISINSVEDTELIKITAIDKDPVMAMRIANEVAAEFTQKVKEVMTFENIKVVEPAEIPEVPESRKRALIVAIAGILGGMLGTFMVLLIEMFHSKLRRPKDIENILGASILTHVPLYEQIGELETLHENSKLKSILKLGEFGKRKSGGKS
ncbi:MAG: Wzz/FepE/Etk N-terminal domain-containing protein [Cetobacterium sp.]|uniref:YveK family protein n=1 Tax=Cetobacterium sp. TaxID=2071632 RepID=UPI002FCAC257